MLQLTKLIKEGSMTIVRNAISHYWEKFKDYYFASYLYISYYVIINMKMIDVF